MIEPELNTELEPFQKKTVPEKYQISIGLTPYLTEDLMLKVLNEYQMNHSKVDIRIKSCSPMVGIQSIKSEHDVFIMPSIPEAIQRLEDTMEQLNLEANLIASSDLFVVASTKSNWAHMGMIYEKQMNQLPLLLPANRSVFTEYYESSIQSDQVVNSVESLKNLVAMNVGVGLITKKEYQYYFADDKKFSLVPTDISQVRYYALLLKGNNLSEEMKNLLKYIAKQF